MAAGSEHRRDAGPKSRVFISYSRKDSAFVDRLEPALKARGFEVLIDREEIYAFEDWWKRIEALIGRADTIVFVLSPDAVISDVALKEVLHAASLNKRFAPIVYRRVEDSAVPEALRRLNFIFFDESAKFEQCADALCKALQTDIGWVRRHTEYGEAERRWAMEGRANGLLLRSPVLEEAEHWLASRPQTAPPPTEETLTFIEESRRAATWRQRRAATIAGVVVLVMGAGLLAWWQQQWLRERIYRWAEVHALTRAQEGALKAKDSFKECTDCPEMIVVPSGHFLMGSPEGQGHFDEHPQHEVTIAQPFAVSMFELTFAQWDACAAQGGCNAHVSDSGFGRGQQPVINVSWDDAKEYVAWLSRTTAKNYRLLSEAEYEYAARAGTQTVFPWGDDIKLNDVPMADCLGCGSKWDGKQPAPVGSLPANAFGLFDMAGNVTEWIEDFYQITYQGAPTNGSAWLAAEDFFPQDRYNHSVRGGSWSSSEEAVKSASRNGYSPYIRSNGLGFRVARTLATSAP